MGESCQVGKRLPQPTWKVSQDVAEVNSIPNVTFTVVSGRDRPDFVVTNGGLDIVRVAVRGSTGATSVDIPRIRMCQEHVVPHKKR